MKHVVFCSQTGSEIVEISKRLGKTPDIFVTNHLKKLSPTTIEFIEKNSIELYVLPFNPVLEDYLKLPLENNLITLHGYLRILPKEICIHTIYNGHPGLILPEFYPELKGKDPQQRVWDNKEDYEWIGVVIHKVIPGVDEGEILAFNCISNTCETKEELFGVLREMSIQEWVKFLS